MSWGIGVRARYTAKSVLAPLLFRYPPIGLQPERLYLWSDTIIATGPLDGALVEIGCSVGGTAAWSNRMAKQIGLDKRYVCVDTFGGFVDQQFATDVPAGTAADTRHMFSANSMDLTRKVCDAHGSPEVELIPADITRIDPALLPERICAALLDVDLSEPIYVGLTLLWERLVPGGLILVDDCPPQGNWRALTGYTRFVEEQGLEPEFRYGMGIVRRAA